MESMLRQRIPPDAPTEHPAPLLTRGSDAQIDPALLGRVQEQRAKQDLVQELANMDFGDTQLLEETLNRMVVPSLRNLERAVTDNEKLLRSFIETLQLWFSDFCTPRKRFQEAYEEHASTSQATRKDADMPNGAQKTLEQPSEKDHVERIIRDQLSSLEQTLNMQFQKVMLQLTLKRHSGQNEVSSGGDASLVRSAEAIDAPKPAETFAVRPSVESDPDTAQVASMADADVITISGSKSRLSEPTASMAETTAGLGLRSQQFRLARHIECLTRATKSRDVSVQIRDWLRVHPRLEGLAAHIHTHNFGVATSLNAKGGRASRKTTHYMTNTHKNDPGMCWKRWRIEAFTDSAIFNVMATMLIVSNAAWITVSTNYAMRQVLLEGKEKPKHFERIDTIFALLFAGELIIRLIAYRMRFFTQPSWRYNVFDIIVVVTGCLDQFTSGVAMNSSVLRAVRLLRVLRMLRFVRALTFFTELQQLLCATMNSAKTIIWTFFLVFFWTSLVAITCMEMILSLGNTDGQGHRETVDKYFGSFTRGVSTLFRCVSFGDLWGAISQDLKKVSPVVEYAIGGHVLLMFFLIVPVLHGTHTMRVLNTQKYEPCVQMTRKLQDASTFFEGLRHRCESQGYHLDHQVDMKTMEVIMEELETNAFLLANDVEVRSEDVFSIFDTENDGMITIRQFIFGCHFLTCISTDSFLLSQQIAMISEEIAAMKDRLKTLGRSVKPEAVVNAKPQRA